MKDYTIFSVEMTCARCKEKTVVNATLLKNQTSVNIEWVCPNCGARRNTTIKRAEAPPAVDKDEKTVKHYTIINGSRVETDDEGNEKTKVSSQFKITSPKKKKESEVPYTVVRKVE